MQASAPETGPPFSGGTRTARAWTAAVLHTAWAGGEDFRKGGFPVFEDKQRIIQEFVPGKQVTLAHLIANPDKDLYKKLGVVGEVKEALGIMTITPSEAAIIGADVATKAAEVSLVFVDRFSGSLIITGDVASVEASLRAVLRVLENTLRFTPTEITRT